MASQWQWAGLTCEGDATLILAGHSGNTVTGFHNDYPGISVPEGKTLTIKGSGSLTARCGDPSSIGGAGIGAPYSIGQGAEGTCGAISIGGTVYWDGSAWQNGGQSYLAASPLVYSAE